MITVTHRPLTNKPNMKAFFVLALVAVAAADVSHLVRSPEADAQIISQDADVFPDQYRYSYETSNGIAAQERGQLKSVPNEGEAIAVEGSNSYTAPGGVQISISYIADENGYQPQGAHLPTPPAPEPIPEYIARALEYIRTHPPAPETIKRVLV